MSLFPIFKVNKLSDQNKTDIIYVFFGTNLDINNKDPNDLFKSDPTNDAFSNIFDEQELDDIRRKNIQVVFLRQSIHIDDSIGVIKLKIFEALRRSVSMSEIYLFCLKGEKLNPITMYQNLTQNDYLPLTRVRLEQMLKNIYDEDGEPIDFGLQKKEKYTFDDILKLDLTERTYLVAKILGQKFVFNNEYPFIADPFYVTEYDALLEHSRKELTSLNNSLLLETVPIFKNTIYLCAAPDVFAVASNKKGISIEYTCKIYFPFLYQDRIDSIEKLDEERDKLIESTSTKMTPDTQKGFESVNMFYDVFQYKEPSKKFSEKRQNTGIKFIKIIMHPDFKIKIPIDVIFKLIHATKEFPLIKYNPETRQENIYRLYTEQLTLDGRKIPFLNKAVIFKLMKNIGKGRSVAVYTNIFFKGVQYLMACEFADDGSITVFPLTDFETPIYFDDINMLDDIDNIINLALNPLIEQIKPFFEQSGLEIALFTSIKSTNVEIRELTYQTVYSITKPIDINKYMGCVSSAFTVESGNFKKGIEMRFKRVANFNKRDSQEAFIIEKIDQGLKFDEIVEELVENYNEIDKDAAADLISKIRSELEVTRGANRRRSLMIKINPGFKTSISLNSFTSEITVTVHGINDIYYLNTIPVYIDTLVRITQDISSSRIKQSEIKKICTGSELEDVEFMQITSQAEKSLKENAVPDIQDENPVYSEKKPYDKETVGQNIDDLLGMLGFDDDEDDAEQKKSKGGDTSSSGKSVSTDDLSSVESIKDLSPSSVDPNKDVFQDKPLAIPTSKVNAGLSEENSGLSEENSGKDVKTPSLSSDSSDEAKPPLVQDKIPLVQDKPPLVQDKPPIVQVEVNVNKPPTPEAVKPPVAVEAVTVEAVKPPTPEAVTVEAVKPPAVEAVKPTTPPVAVEEEFFVKSKPKVKKAKEQKIEMVAKELENTVRNITGMKLKYPNPFSARLEHRASQLFVREKNDKIDVYTRMCPFSMNDRRQPVILSKQEKEELIADHPDINQESDFIEYSTDPKDSSKKFYYTCPRFWCMLTDKMVTEQDILDGKCGPKVSRVEDAIIPKSADQIKDDNRYVYQFYDDKERKYPGFHKKQTPGGLCIPCCYNKWSTEEMKSRRDICQGKSEPAADSNAADKSETGSNEEGQEVGREEGKDIEVEKEKSIEEQLRQDVQNGENYVKGPEKFGPQLGEHRWGFLPIAVQKFLHEVNEDCQVSKMDPSLKPNHTCILRHGVEVNSQQSFIACIASAMFYGQRDGSAKRDPPLITKFIPNAQNDIPTIEEMKMQVIIPAINIDKFVKYQNGDLITSFASLDAEVDINKPEYTKSKLFKKIEETRGTYVVDKEEGSSEGAAEGAKEISSKEKPLEFFTRVVQAYENFISFLKDPKIYIDYTYLWDLICMPNSKLFEQGINLVILEMPDDDITNNIELVCPTNRYSAHIFDSRKRTLFLIKRDTYFEPIYGYRNDTVKDEIQITKTFSEYDLKLPSTLRLVFKKIIKPTLGKNCRTFLSKPHTILNKPYEYRFQHPLLLDTLIALLLDKGYTVLTQVLNFQGKVIGLLTRSSKGLEGFVPCYPSSLTILKNTKKYGKKVCDLDTSCDYDFVYMTDEIWKPYDETLAFLKEYYDYKEPENMDKAECFASNSFCRVVKDELIIGFLTNTNQFIRIYDPIPVSSVDDNIKTFTNNDMLVADIETLTTLDVDTKRTDFIKRIQLETNFYNVFRNTIRILFNDYSNSDKRKTIQDECNKRFLVYRQQVDTVVSMLHDLVGSSIIFSTKSEGFNYQDVNENEIHNCIKLSKDKCRDDVSGICRITEDKCTLVLPKNNLITDSDNEVFYYGRMADELIRYNRIKSFIFKPQSYLSFGQIKYNLRDNEILILQDLITQEFFENLIPADINRFAKYNTYDTANPIISVSYKKDFELDDVINPNRVRDCVKSEPEKITSDIWNKCFPSNYREISYTQSNFCGLYLIIDIIKQINGEIKTVEELKVELLNIYRELTDSAKNTTRFKTIRQILKDDGQYMAQDIVFNVLIGSDEFYPVNFDLWLLLVRFKIPSIFISTFRISSSGDNRFEFVCYKAKKDDQKYVFIVTPGTYEVRPEYKLIVDDTNNYNISLDSLRPGDCLQNIERSIREFYTIERYIDKLFKKRTTTKYKKKKERGEDFYAMLNAADPQSEEEADRQLEELDVDGTTKYKKQQKVHGILSEADPDVDIDVEVQQGKKVNLKKGRKLKEKIVLTEEAEEGEDAKQAAESLRPDTFVNLDEEEAFEIEIPQSQLQKIVKPKATRTRRAPVKVNPPGNARVIKKTKKNLSPEK